MKEYINDILEECTSNFQKLLLIDNYISIKQLENFQEKYKDSFILLNKGYTDENSILYKKIKSIVNDGHNVIQRRNQVYIKRKLKELQSYFDNMFKDIDDNIVLNEEQRKIIISDEDYSLIVSFPGTGKTTTAIAKIKYLIDIKNIDPNSIIFICATKDAKEDIIKMLQTYFNINISVYTMEELELKFITDTNNINYQIVKKEDIKNIISKYIINYIFPNKDVLKYWTSIFNDKIFLENYAIDYTSFYEYYKYYVDEQYNFYKPNLENYIMQKINSLTYQYISIKGEKMRNITEVQIANYLYLNGFEYNYFNKLENDKYIPDFEVILPNKKLYIEYYSLTNKKKDGTYVVSDINVRKNLKKKQKILIEKYKDNLIELYSNSNPIETLDNALKEKKKNRTKKETFYQLYEYNKIFQFDQLIEFLIEFIKTFKEKKYNINDFDMLIKHQYNENVKKRLILIRDIYEYYEDYLKNNDMIDPNDIINKASDSIEKYKHDNKNAKYSYVVIDDYQYLSPSTTSLLKKISTLFNAKIIALGDDWETLYAFNKKDINMFKEFYNIMGYANIIRMSNSYRSSREILDVASNFIGNNFNTYSKELVSLNHINKPIEINYYEKDNMYEKYIAISNIIRKIYKQNKNDKILILGLYKNDITEYISNDVFKMGKNGLLIFNEIPSAHIYYKTINSSKGLEYDQVILINESCKCNFNNDKILKLLEIEEEFVEEIDQRRIFYMALTRTKNKLYIINSYDKKLCNINENISIIVNK